MKVRLGLVGVLIASVVLSSCLVANPTPAQRLKTTQVPPIPVTMSVRYGPDAGQQLDVYAPYFWRPVDSRPAIVFVHGGGWNGGSRADLDRLFKSELRRGWVVISVDYRLSFGVDWPTPVQDVDRAVRYVRAHAGELGIDPDEIVTAGHSAGAHLVLAQGLGQGDRRFVAPDLPGELATVSSRPTAIVDMSGPVDLVSWLEDDWEASEYALNLLFGCDPSVFQTLTCPMSTVAAGSVLDLLDSRDPPMYIAHGASDDVVRLRQPFMLYHRAMFLGMFRTVWLDVVDTGPVDGRGHFPGLGVNLATLDLFLDLAVHGTLR